MATASVERERKRVRSRARMEAGRPANDAGAPKPKLVEKRGAYGRKQSGVDLLREKGKLTQPQASIANRYGVWWRGADLAESGSIKSAMSFSGGGGRGGDGDYFEAFLQDRRARTKTVNLQADSAAWIVDCVSKRDACHAALSHLTYLVATLAAVAGKGCSVNQIAPDDPRGQVEIVTSLRTALDLLIARERADGPF